MILLFGHRVELIIQYLQLIEHWKSSEIIYAAPIVVVVVVVVFVVVVVMFVSSCRSFVNGLSFVANDSPDTHVCPSVCMCICVHCHMYVYVYVCPQVWVPDERSMT